MLSEWLSGEASLNYLKQSLIYSKALTLDECYAMRLMADIFRIEPGDMPGAIAMERINASRPPYWGGSHFIGAAGTCESS